MVSFIKEWFKKEEVKEWQMDWSPRGQYFGNGKEGHKNKGEIGTNPSHDLVHIILGAHGGIPWLPYKERETTCYVEYNAVLLENVFNHCMPGAYGHPQKAVEATRQHLLWFCNVHFAPFPCTEKEAFAKFASAVDPDTILRLFPFYGELRWQECTDPHYRKRRYQISFSPEDDPKEKVGKTFPSAWLELVKEALALMQMTK